MFAANPHNFVRASSLQPLSLEMLALLIAVVIAYRHRGSGLLGLYALSIPFTDVVYRLGPILISDVLGLLLLVQRARRGRPWLVAPLLIWVGWGLAVNLFNAGSLFSFAYSIRFVAILLIAGLIDLSAVDARRAVRMLRAGVILAAVNSVLQVVLWRLGLPIDGVFAALGFVRPKGLAHEPSTSAAWFAMAIPLLSAPLAAAGVRRRVDMPLLASIVVGLALTASLSGLLIAGVIVGAKAARAMVRMPRRRLAATLIGSLAVAVGGLIVFAGQAGYLFDKVGQYVAEYSGGAEGTPTAQASGREGDLVLLQRSDVGVSEGEGIFTSTETAERLLDEQGVIIPSANILITAFVETGGIGLLLFLAALAVTFTRVVRRFSGRAPDVVAGFGGFIAVLLGQRLLAFHQPWFMLAVADGVDRSGHSDEPERDAIAPPDTNRRGHPDMQPDRQNVNVLQALRRYWRSSLVILLVGLAIVGAAAVKLGSQTRVEMTIGLTGEGQRVAALELPGGLLPEFDGTLEAAAIGLSYDVTATGSGRSVTLSRTASSVSAGTAELQRIADEFLAEANAGWVEALVAAEAFSDEKITRYRSELEAVDNQLADASLDPGTRVALAVQRAEVAEELAAAELEQYSYSQLGADVAPIGVTREASEASGTSNRALLVVVLGLFAVLAAVIGQAWWRASSEQATGRRA